MLSYGCKVSVTSILSYPTAFIHSKVSFQSSTTVYRIRLSPLPVGGIDGSSDMIASLLSPSSGGHFCAQTLTRSRGHGNTGLPDYSHRAKLLHFKNQWKIWITEYRAGLKGGPQVLWIWGEKDALSHLQQAGGRNFSPHIHATSGK